jgi:hypothetical protein
MGCNGNTTLSAVKPVGATGAIATGLAVALIKTIDIGIEDCPFTAQQAAIAQLAIEHPLTTNCFA